MARKAAFVLLLAALAMSCKAPPAGPVYSTGEFSVAGAATHANIYYQAFGGASVNVLYNVPLPWSRSFSGVQTGDPYYLGAQSNDSASATVDVLVNSVSIKSDASAAFGYVAVYGTVP